jgi:hypothetical protein
MRNAVLLRDGFRRLFASAYEARDFDENTYGYF